MTWIPFSFQAFNVDLYSIAAEGKEHVGRASILPQHIEANAGKIVLTVLSPQLLPIGTITCEACITSSLVP